MSRGRGRRAHAVEEADSASPIGDNPHESASRLLQSLLDGGGAPGAEVVAATAILESRRRGLVDGRARYDWLPNLHDRRAVAVAAA